MASISIDGAVVGASSTGKGLACIIVEAREGVCGMVCFGVIPVSAVVGVG